MNEYLFSEECNQDMDSFLQSEELTSLQNDSLEVHPGKFPWSNILCSVIHFTGQYSEVSPDAKQCNQLTRTFISIFK